LNQNALLPAGSKRLSVPNSTPSAADTRAAPSTDQPRHGAVLGLVGSFTVELPPSAFSRLPPVPRRTSSTLIVPRSLRTRTIPTTRRRTGGERPAASRQQLTRNDSKRQGQRHDRSIAPGPEMAMLALHGRGLQLLAPAAAHLHDRWAGSSGAAPLTHEATRVTTRHINGFTGTLSAPR
jgi:hypothetical protein